MSLDNLTRKLEGYDSEYRTKLKTFKASLQDPRWKADAYGNGMSKTPSELARVDAAEILRQSRTKNLWKYLRDRRERGHRLLSPEAEPNLCPGEDNYDPLADPEFPVDEYVENVLPGQLDVETAFVHEQEPEMASYIGTRFYDPEMGFCKITGWGFAKGIAVLFYVSEDSTDPQKDEEYSSLPEVLAWIKACPICQIPDDPRPQYPQQEEDESPRLGVRQSK